MYLVLAYEVSIKCVGLKQQLTLNLEPNGGYVSQAENIDLLSCLSRGYKIYQPGYGVAHKIVSLWVFIAK